MQELDKAQAEQVTGAKRPPITTLAVGEEGGGVVTTLAIGEEGGPIVTTLAVGEEGPVATTLALGEEGGGCTPSASSGGALGSF